MDMTLPSSDSWIQRNRKYLLENINRVEIALMTFVETGDERQPKGKSEQQERDDIEYHDNGNYGNDDDGYIKSTLTPAQDSTINQQQRKKQQEENEEDKEKNDTEKRKEMDKELERPLALDVICNAFELSPFEKSALLLCAGVELKSDIANLCARAHGNSNFSYPTFGLAIAFLPDAHWSALLPTSPLRRFKLITMMSLPNTPLVKCPIKIEEKVLHYLTGISYLDKQLWGTMIRRVTSEDPLLSSSQKQIAQAIVNTYLTDVLSRDTNSSSAENNYGTLIKHNTRSDISRVRCFELFGTDEITKAEVARLVCSKVGLHLWKINAESLSQARPEETENFLAIWSREAILLGCGLYVSAEEIAEVQTRRVILQLLMSNQIPGPIFLGTSERWGLSSYDSPISFEVKKPTKEDQHKIWKEYVASSKITKDISINDAELWKITDCYDFSSADIVLAFEQAQLSIGPNQNQDIYSSPSFLLALRRSCSIIANHKMSDLAVQGRSNATLNDIILPSMQKDLIRAITVHVKHRKKVYEEFGFATKTNRGLGITALFAGESGTGKTMEQK